MNQEQCLKKIFPCIGGEDNVIRKEFRDSSLIIIVKDASVVNLDPLRNMEDVFDVFISRNRLKLGIKEKEMNKENTMKYEVLCNEILKIIPKDNIKTVFHCVTRLRFIVKDKGAVDQEALKRIEGVLQIRDSGEQIQVVIGPHVGDVYEEFCEIAGVEKKAEVQEEKEEVGSVEQKEKKSISLAGLLDVLSSIFTPVIPAFSAGGMIKCVSMLLTAFGILEAENGVIIMLDTIGDAPFYFLPFIVAYTASKRFKLNEVLGLMAAGCLMYPTILGQTAGESVHFLFFDIPCINYATSVLPVLLAVILLSYVYRWLDKRIPKNVGLVFTGMITFMVCMPVILWIIAPLGYNCGVVLGKVMLYLFNTVGPLAGALFAGFMPFLVITGMHTCLDVVILQNFATYGYDYLYPVFLINNFAVAGATLGASFKIKDAKMKSMAISNGSLGIFGITEPALYGINVRYRQSLAGAVIGGCVGGAIYMLAHVVCYAYTMPSIFSLVSYVDGGNNVIWMVVSMVASFVAAFTYSIIFTKKEEENV